MPKLINNIHQDLVTKIDFMDWLKCWLVDTVQPCSGCNSDIRFQDQAFVHSKYEGIFCNDCAKNLEVGTLPHCLR